ncbi:uncharacterized protein LOC117173805 [Belonocnema kinseyi]|uniref:uncharacterized protein LOC117173805 n=1 Tax=Belonocnema kinseyi TaxID=2817044 RepID=UPI00143D9E6A|nr:uncharacterized protein LOC117173805 [Belonocnema kinseyi]
MKIFILLLSYVIFLNITTLEALFSRAVNQMFEFYGLKTVHPDIRRGDFVSLILRGVEPFTRISGGVYTGSLEGPVENPEAVQRGPTDNRFFVRLSHGVFYANLVHRPDLTEDLGGPNRCYIVGPEDKNGRRGIVFSAALALHKPAEPSNIWLEKNALNERKTPYMWGVNFEQRKHGVLPRWALKENVESAERIESSQY